MAKLANWTAFLSLASLCFGLTASATGQRESAPPMREVNVTSDSEPGWIPSAQQSAMAETTARNYWAAEDAGNAEAAYGYFADLNKRGVPFENYRTNLGAFHARSGAVVERRIVKVTWTKDSPQAPFPGIYAAIDVASRFANIDRDCGYLILYQAPSGSTFQVMREESNVMDNATAAAIARKHSDAYRDNVWAQLSANCPNYSAQTR